MMFTAEELIALTNLLNRTPMSPAEQLWAQAVGAKTLTTTGFIKVAINGDTRYIAAGTIA